MAEQFDVIIVGARCAGSPLATLLARAGVGVCVVDRSTFPSEIASTHGIQPCGVQVLDRLGVLEPLLEVAPPVERGTLVLDDVRIDVEDLSRIAGAPMVNARRVTLDELLVDTAAEAGADVRPGTAVTELIEEHGRVAGVRTKSGDLRAQLVVGADGPRSTVARLTGAAEYHRTEPGALFAWGYYEGVPSANDRLWLGKIGDYGFLASPTDNGLFIAAVVLPLDRHDEVRAERDRVHADALAHWPELQASMDGAERVGPVRTMSRWHGFFRESAGPGWALVGDAGHFKDPTPGQGIADALRQSERLAPAILDGLAGGERALDEATARWWAWRDHDAWEMYWFARDMGRPGATPPLLAEVQRRIATDPHLTENLVRVISSHLAPSAAFPVSVPLKALAHTLVTRRGERRRILREAWALAAETVRRRVKAPPDPTAQPSAGRGRPRRSLGVVASAR
jgi:menaquinone-9 beta-reductase